MSNKALWAIYGGEDVDGGYGDAIPTSWHIATVLATEDEIEAFVKKWNKPEVYDIPYDSLECHRVYAERIEIVDLESVIPYSTDPDNYYMNAIEQTKKLLQQRGTTNEN